MKRSPRHGWTLVRLVDGQLRHVAKGDRDTLRAQREEIAREIVDLTPTSLFRSGHGVALYDANGALRDSYPSLPRLADETRVRWPESLECDGSAPAVRSYQPRATAGVAS